ncbi:zinc-dependent peptidase [soil metagenome]
MQIARRSDLVFVIILALALGGGVALIGYRIDPLLVWIGPLAMALVVLIGAKRPIRRFRAVRKSFPETWKSWLAENIPLYEEMAVEGRERFEHDIQMFLSDQSFEGVGAEVTDDLRLMVGAGAALMLAGRPEWELPHGRTILFYPESFDDRYDLGEGRDPFDDAPDIDGMVHPQGPVILSVPSVEEGWRYSGDGCNVVLHELAHLFDFDSQGADGVPSLMDPASAEAWQRLVRAEMRRARTGKSLLSRYAATHPSELFAVAVERFFERPVDMAALHPELFEALTNFFNLDPRPAASQTTSEADQGVSIMSRRWRAE